MSQKPQPAATEKLPAEIAELAVLVNSLPDEYRAKIQPAVARVVQSAQRRRKILELVQEALSQLRLDMKYLIFDLEATRKERDEYKRQLEEL